MGCSASKPLVQVKRLKSGMLRVEGPAAGPFENTEELAARACEVMAARSGESYCALGHYAVEEDAYYLGHLSGFTREDSKGARACEVPRALDQAMDAQGGRRLLILGATHDRETSPQDMGLGVSRFLDGTTHRIWERELFVFHREAGGTCRSFKYSYATRGVYALREGRWLLMGKADGRWGTFKPLEGRVR